MYNNLRNQLTNEELLVVNSEVERLQKNTAVAFLLCIFLGTLGAHRYYMGRTGSAVAMTLITVLTFGVGTIVTGIWTLVDLFLISDWLRDDREKIATNAAMAAINRRGMQNTANNF